MTSTDFILNMNFFDPAKQTIFPLAVAVVMFLAAEVCVCVLIGRLKGRRWPRFALLGLIPFLGPIYALVAEKREGIRPLGTGSIISLLAAVYLGGGLIAALSVVLWEHTTTTIRSSAYKRIVRDVYNLRDQCEYVPSTQLRIKGKCLIWDTTKDNVSKVHDRLPDDLRARISEDQITVVIVGKPRLIDTGQVYLRKDKEDAYKTDPMASLLAQKAYACDVDVYFFYWPDKVPAGKLIVHIDPPKEVEGILSDPNDLRGIVPGDVSRLYLDGEVVRLVTKLPR